MYWLLLYCDSPSFCLKLATSHLLKHFDCVHMCNLYVSLWCPGTDFFSQQFYFIWSVILILLCPAVWFAHLLTGQACLVCTSFGRSGLFGLHVCWMVRPVWFARLLDGQACLVHTSVGWSGLFGLHVLDGQACLVCMSVGWSGLFGLHVCWMVRPVWFACVGWSGLFGLHVCWMVRPVWFACVGWSGLFGLHVCWMVRPVWFACLLDGQACLVCMSVGWSGLFGLHVCWMVRPVRKVAIPLPPSLFFTSVSITCLLTSHCKTILCCFGA